MYTYTVQKQYTLIDSSWRPIAAGSWDAIRAAARLFYDLPDSRIVLVSPIEQDIFGAVNTAALNDIKAQTDAEVFGSLMASAQV